MKFRTIIDRSCEEEVVIHAKERSRSVERLEEFVANLDNTLIGYGASREIVRLSPSEVHCFLTEDGKVYALTDTQKLRLHQRLYELEELGESNLIKINQSCIANTEKIDRFEVSFGGALAVVFKNGHRDYVSRRQLKYVKERIGLSQ